MIMGVLMSWSLGPGLWFVWKAFTVDNLVSVLFG